LKKKQKKKVEVKNKKKGAAQHKGKLRIFERIQSRDQPGKTRTINNEEMVFRGKT